jgi:hypothetical protein
MKFTNVYFVILFFLAILVPTELLHYMHVFGDLTEHYEHHQNLSFSEFLDHALGEKGTDQSHPEHNHSPFQKHHSVCATSFVSVLPEQGKLVVENQILFHEESVKGVKISTHSLKDIYLSIWQPPKLS